MTEPCDVHVVHRRRSGQVFSRTTHRLGVCLVDEGDADDADGVNPEVSNVCLDGLFVDNLGSASISYYLGCPDHPLLCCKRREVEISACFLHSVFPHLARAASAAGHNEATQAAPLSVWPWRLGGRIRT